MSFDDLPRAIYTVAGAGGIAGLYGLAKYFFLTKKDVKAFDHKIMDGLYDRVRILEGALQAQTDMIFKALQQVASKDEEIKILRERITALEVELKQYHNGSKK